MKIGVIILLVIVLLLIIASVITLRSIKVKQIIVSKKAERGQKEQERKAREEEERERLEQERLEEERKKIELKQAVEKLHNDFLLHNPYIAISDWEYHKQQIMAIDPSVILSDNIVLEHNTNFTSQQKEEHKEYFDTIFKYPLDEQQRDAIVTLGENVLVTAAAGSGKTSTIVAKTDYLVNKLNVDPRNILVITYTRKAAEELQTRVGVSGVECTTFHKHAIDTIASIEGRKPSICDSNTIHDVFDALIKGNNKFEASILQCQTTQKTLLKYDYDYTTYKEYLNALERYGKLVPYKDMDNKMCYVKSRQEMELMIVLTELGLNVRYEEKYEYDTESTKYRQYKPDFTIHYLQDGIDKKLYFEHFAIDSTGRVPVWFGDGKQGGWAKANRDYNEGIVWKKQLHENNGTTLVYTTSADFYNGIVSARERILNILKMHNVPIKELSIEEKIEKLSVPFARSVESLVKLVSGFITLAKANSKTISDVVDAITDFDANKDRNTYILEHLVQPVYDLYEETLRNNNECDFTDCLLDASKLLKDNQIYNYDYILVDEFQDMSMDKYLYLNALRRKYPRTRIFCVGDDWQSIYRFSGSDISLFSQFEKFNGKTEELKIESTHRFGEPLLQRSSDFVLMNPAQKRKKLRPDADKVTHFAFAGYETEDQEREIIEKQIARLPEGSSVYVVSRYRYTIGNVFPEVASQVMNEMGGSVVLNIAGRRVEALTAHSCKGLEADYVFLINCNSGYDDYGFPSQIADDPILEYVLSSSDSYNHAEERRVFYVAITRAKRATYVLYDKQYPSLFVTELGGIKGEVTDKKKVCPRCQSGSLMYIKDGYAKNGHFYTVLRCTNKDCDLKSETLFFNPEKHAYEIIPFEQFLKSRRVTTKEMSQIRVGTSRDYVNPVLLIPCKDSFSQVLSIAIDPRYEMYDLAKFYKYHLDKGDLTVSVQFNGHIERLLLTVDKQAKTIHTKNTNVYKPC